MQKENKPLYIRTKVWIEDDTGQVLFGMGRVRMLEAIHRNGSIQSAAKDLGMSYARSGGESKPLRNVLERHY